MASTNLVLPHAIAHTKLVAELKKHPEELNTRFPNGALVMRSAGPRAPAPRSASVGAADFDDDVVTATADTSFLVLPLVKSDRNVFPHLTVGRTRNHDLVIIDDAVSKFHASLRIEHGTLMALDEGSRNGTTIDAKSVPARGAGAPVAVPPHATISFGTVGLVYLAPNDLREFLGGLTAR